MASVYKKSIAYLLLSLLIVGSFGLFHWTNMYPLYSQYRALWQYRLLHPEFIPTSSFLRASSAGHETTYADMIWISLIQYIGDNLATRAYDDFAPTILERIYDLHPHFVKPYELSLLLMPTIARNETGTGAEAKQAKVRKTLSSIEARLGNICDLSKIEKIIHVKNFEELWKNDELRNPCRSGQIPYYTGFHYYNDLSMNAKAKEYYMIASTQTDTPIASRYLVALMDGNAGNYMTAAFSLLSLAIQGEDDERNICLDATVAASRIISTGVSKNTIDTPDIRTLIDIEKRLYKNPMEVKSKTPTIECREYLTRAIKQTFLAYIDARAMEMERTTGIFPGSSEEMEKAGFLALTPHLSGTKGQLYFYNSLSNIWEYTTPEYAQIRSK